ncbi:MAG: hypothetical protein ACOC1K_03165 [Nanoarchaeota archaeon]
MARVKSFTAGRGVTIEHRGIYHKFNCSIEIEIEEGDDTTDIKEKAWNTVDKELEKKIDEVLSEEN